MAMQTRCPACGTAFRITPEQLRVKGGRVRCGHCRAVFNALSYLVEERKSTPPTTQAEAVAHDAALNALEAYALPESSETLEDFAALPETPEASASSLLPDEPAPPTDAWPADEAEDSAEQAEAPVFEEAEPLAADTALADDASAAGFDAHSDDTTIAPNEADTVPDETTLPAEDADPDPEADTAPEDTNPESQINALLADLEAGTRDIPEPPLTLSDPPTERILEIDLDPDTVQTATDSPDDDDVILPLPPVNRSGPLWLFASVTGILLAIFGVQAAYYLRTELCNSFPDLHPLYAALDIDVPLARNAELIGLETSDLQADAKHDALVLYATIKNKAAYPQAWPMLELTLTDERDNPLARRSFKAEEYLSRTDGQEVAQDPDAPFASHAEVSLRLWLDAREIRAAGYRVYLYYP